MIENRNDITKLLDKKAIAVELGVADGFFSEQILSSEKIKHLYSIDMWAGDRGHDIEQYKRAIKRVSPYYARNTIIRSKFEQVVDLFDDNYFDLIYIDGYAHTGQDNGKTLHQWWPKVKIGGVFSGHDYDEKMWPLTFSIVNDFSLHINKKVLFTKEKKERSWYIVK